MSYHSPIGWGRTARGGAAVGALSAGAYAAIFLGYAIVRSAARLLATPEVDAGLAQTLVATWLSLAVPVAVFAALCALPAMLLGAATALLIRALLVTTPAAPGRAWLLGGGACLGLSLALAALLTRGLGLAWSAGAAEALIFWLVLPLGLYTIAGALASGRLQRALWAA